MIFTILLALSGLVLSSVAIYYSVIGLTAIFAAAFWPIVIMGTSLEVSKLVAASWLKANWPRIPILMKMYMMTAVIVLMLITSMGIFGFLSKAHSDQSLVSGDVLSKIETINEKIKTSKENIDANRAALKQLDAAVDQVMGRSTTEQGAERSVQIRRQQGPERQRLIREIEAEQKKISALNEERAPIAAEVRKVEAEVGPIKYIAKFIYGDDSDSNLLEKAVTWVIIIIVFVFDPLAVLLLLASQMTWQWYKEDKEQEKYPTIADLDRDVGEPPTEDEIKKYEQDDGPLTDEQLTQIKETANKQLIDNKITCYRCGGELSNVPGIGLFCPNKSCGTNDEVEDKDDDSEENETVYTSKAKAKWKEENPNETLKHYRKLYELGMIDKLPWEDPKYYNGEDTYKQNSEQSEMTLWKKILGKKKDV